MWKIASRNVYILDGLIDTVKTLLPIEKKAYTDIKMMPKATFSLLFPTDCYSFYAGQEATVRTEHGTTDWFQIEKGVCRGCILSPCLFNLYAEYIM